MGTRVMDEKELQVLAEQVLNEIPSKRNDDVRAIQDWIRKQPHLREYGRSDEEFVLNFLRGSKFSYEKAKRKIDMWHTVRTHCPEFFQGWDPLAPDIHSILEKGVNVHLPGYDKHGRKVILLRSVPMDLVENYQLESMLKVSFMLNELSMKKSDFQGAVKGVVIINDVTGANMSMLKLWTPPIMKKMITIFQEAYPAQPKENHLLNLPSFMEGILQVMMSFMAQKMRNRTILHAKGNDFTKIQEALGLDVLPKEYGGSNGYLEDHILAMKEHAVANRKWFLDIEKHKSDEKKRPGKAKTYSDTFGMEGSFRQLTID